MAETLKCGAENCTEEITTEFAHLNRRPWFCSNHLPKEYLNSPEHLNPTSWWACPRCHSRDFYEGTRPAGFAFGTSTTLGSGDSERDVGFARGFEKKVKLCRACGEPVQQYFRKLNDAEKAKLNKDLKAEIPTMLWVIPLWIGIVYVFLHYILEII